MEPPFVVLVWSPGDFDTVSIMHLAADGPPILFRSKEAADSYVGELKRTGNFSVAGTILEHKVVGLGAAPVEAAARSPEGGQG